MESDTNLWLMTNSKDEIYSKLITKSGNDDEAQAQGVSLEDFFRFIYIGLIIIIIKCASRVRSIKEGCKQTWVMLIILDMIQPWLTVQTHVFANGNNATRAVDYSIHIEGTICTLAESIRKVKRRPRFLGHCFSSQNLGGTARTLSVEIRIFIECFCFQRYELECVQKRLAKNSSEYLIMTRWSRFACPKKTKIYTHLNGWKNARQHSGRWIIGWIFLWSICLVAVEWKWCEGRRKWIWYKLFALSTR